MRSRRLIRIAVNAAAVLLIGLAGAAIAAPITVGSLELFGPELLAPPYSFAYYFVSSAQFLFGTPAYAPSGTFYVIPNVSGVLSALDSNIGPLLSANIQNVGLLPASDPIFLSAVPEPVGAAVFISAIAALGYLRRRNVRRRRGG